MTSWRRALFAAAAAATWTFYDSTEAVATSLDLAGDWRFNFRERARNDKWEKQRKEEDSFYDTLPEWHRHWVAAKRGQGQMAGFAAYNQCFMLIFYDKKSSSSGPQLWTIIKLEFRRILEITTVVEVIFGGCSEVMSIFLFYGLKREKVVCVMFQVLQKLRK